MATWDGRRGGEFLGENGRNRAAGVALNLSLSGRALLQAGESCTIRLDKHWHVPELAAVRRSLPRAAGVIVL